MSVQLKKAMLMGEISGYLGRLGDLGKISSEFDIAITSACPALNNFVVEVYVFIQTVEDAQKCIKWLRDNKVGRGTFVSLDKCIYI